MSVNNPVRIRLVDWNGAKSRAAVIRIAVFVQEQGVPEALEWDEFDSPSCHALAEIQDRCIGTGRLLPDGHLGRLAVLPHWRGQGVGTAILTALLAEAQRLNLPLVQLHAQCQAEGFYQRHGFVAKGPVFDEAGIPHRLMERPIHPL